MRVRIAPSEIVFDRLPCPRRSFRAIVERASSAKFRAFPHVAEGAHAYRLENNRGAGVFGEISHFPAPRRMCSHIQARATHVACLSLERTKHRSLESRIVNKRPRRRPMTALVSEQKICSRTQARVTRIVDSGSTEGACISETTLSKDISGHLEGAE
jgi:hypothetical protein